MMSDAYSFYLFLWRKALGLSCLCSFPFVNGCPLPLPFFSIKNDHPQAASFVFLLHVSCTLSAWLKFSMYKYCIQCVCINRINDFTIRYCCWVPLGSDEENGGGRESSKQQWETLTNEYWQGNHRLLWEWEKSMQRSCSQAGWQSEVFFMA